MFYLILAVLAGAIKGYCGKKISNIANTSTKVAKVGAFRMVICCLIGVLIALIGGASLRINNMTELLIYIFSGLSTSLALLFWTLSARGGAYILVSAFTHASFIIPMLFGFFVFGETISIKQIISMAFIVASIFLLINYNNKIKAKLTFTDLIILIVNFITTGTTNLSQKMFTKYVEGGNTAVFNFYTFLVALIVFLIWFLIGDIKAKKESSPLPWKNILLVISIMAVLLFVNSYLLTLATEQMTSVMLFALNTVLSLACATVISVVFLKEKLTVTSSIGIACVLVAMLLSR